jgi:hypothetical protein
MSVVGGIFSGTNPLITAARMQETRSPSFSNSGVFQQAARLVGYPAAGRRAVQDPFTPPVVCESLAGKMARRRLRSQSGSEAMVFSQLIFFASEKACRPRRFLSDSCHLVNRKYERPTIEHKQKRFRQEICCRLASSRKCWDPDRFG